ncbi:MAG: LysM peptidoglycan-binding domain-containing protein [Anaerolineales bacterium]|nr:LysM peptidoglycan-binding domain-containing protein [Anaerolineales bacterium]
MGKKGRMLLSIPVVVLLASFLNPFHLYSVETSSLTQGTFPTPTPDAEGNIIYVVQSGDSPWTIAAVAGITLEELYALNGMQQDDFITPGMQLLLGTAPLPTETSPPAAQLTETAMAIPSTPVYGVGEICILIFEDENGNARLDETEGALPDGQISVIGVDGTQVGEHTTDTDPEGFCFKDVEYGDYNVSAAVPEHFNATTSMNLGITLEAGDVSYIQFGAQASGVVDLPDNDQGNQRSLVLGILGVCLLIAAGGLGFYAFRYTR